MLLGKGRGYSYSWLGLIKVQFLFLQLFEIVLLYQDVRIKGVVQLFVLIYSGGKLRITITVQGGKIFGVIQFCVILWSYLLKGAIFWTSLENQRQVIGNRLACCSFLTDPAI